ncbi:unnamed protein product [Echinostoma caproni]|uniref:Transposase n=1 Tax=Echinostoma caproni TaxID=27848 RepID=A0A183BA37_9TREM|nr:unnamed protein product [Echinostoma caproni]
MQTRKHRPRSQCIIAVNLPEAEATTAQAGLDHDLRLRWSHMVTLFDGGEVEPAASIRVEAALRPGKPRQYNSPRPLKVILRAIGEAKVKIQRTHNLKGTPLRFLRELDSDQRSKLKTALEELRERCVKEETDLCIRDFPVHRKRPQLRWLLFFGEGLRRLLNHGQGIRLRQEWRGNHAVLASINT